MSRFALLLASLLLPAFCTAAPGRSPEDVERDARDKPAEVLAFAGVAPGMHVADLFAGGGYWSELLHDAVGAEGHVLLYNNPQYAKFGQAGLDARFADSRLAPIERRVAQPSKMQLGSATLDRAVMVMAFHDLYWVDEAKGWPAIDRAAFIAQVAQALKPGGALLIIDHAAVAGSGESAVNPLHRIDERFVQAEIERHGLKLEAESGLLRNPTDKRLSGVFDPKVKGKTDRFVHLYRKPDAPTP